MSATDPEQKAKPPYDQPWSVKGIPPSLRTRIKAAARRDGLTVGAWLAMAAETALKRDVESADKVDQLDARLAALETESATKTTPGDENWEALGRAITKLAERIEQLEAQQQNESGLDWVYRTFDRR